MNTTRTTSQQEVPWSVIKCHEGVWVNEWSEIGINERLKSSFLKNIPFLKKSKDENYEDNVLML